MLNASFLPLESESKSQQIADEIRAARDLGIPWTAVMFHPHSSRDSAFQHLNVAPANFQGPREYSLLHRAISNIRGRRAFYRWLKTVHDNYDFVLLRYSPHDFGQYLFARRRKGSVGFVHHAIESRALLLERWPVGLMRSWMERLMGAATLRQASIAIGVTSEITHFQERRLGRGRRHQHLNSYPNGLYRSVEVVEDARTNIPELIFVSTRFSPWHGLDLLLSSISESTAEFMVHVVGQVPTPYLEQASSDQRVRFHGTLDSKAIRGISKSCWMGISTLASNRAGLTMTCSLKARDYWSMGLPVYAGENDVMPEDFPFLVVGEPDIEQMLDTAHQWRGISRQVVADAAWPYIDKRILVSMLYEEIRTKFAT